jgi:hypothetical protein
VHHEPTGSPDEATIAQQHVDDVGTAVARLVESIGRCTDEAAFRSLVRSSLLDVAAAERRDQRMRGLGVLGSAHAQPSLGAMVAHSHDSAAKALATALQGPRAKGWIVPDLDLAAVASWSIGQITALALVDMGADGVDADAVTAMSIDAVLTVLFGQPPAQPGADAVTFGPAGRRGAAPR